MSGNGQKASRTPPPPRFKRPFWLPEVTIRTSSIRPLPPMTQLTQLDISFDRRYRGVHFHKAMRSTSAVPILIHLAWVIALNTAGLKRVTFRRMTSVEPLELRCLARTLSKLMNLTYYKIEMTERPMMGFLEAPLTLPMVLVLVFSLPKSMVSANMEANVRRLLGCGTREGKLMLVQKGAAEQGEGRESRKASLGWAEDDLVAREGPLENLKELILPSLSLGYDGK